MTVGRRAFVLGTARIATAPALASLLSLSASAQSRSPLSPAPPSTQLALRTTNENGLILRIAGWSPDDDSAIDDRATTDDSVTDNGTAQQVWVRLDRSWRAAWR